LFNLECFADLDGLINRYMKRPTMVTTITRGPYFTASFCTDEKMPQVRKPFVFLYITSIALHLDIDFHYKPYNNVKENQGPIPMTTLDTKKGVMNSPSPVHRMMHPLPHHPPNIHTHTKRAAMFSCQ
jgi:hypothetical protein